MYLSLFSHSPAEGHLDYIHALAIMNKAAINIHTIQKSCFLVFTKINWTLMSTQRPAYKCLLDVSVCWFILNYTLYIVYMGFSDGTVVKNLAINAGDTGLISGLGRCPGGGNGHPLQYSCLENPLDRGAWWVTVYNVTESRTQLSTHACIFCVYNEYHTKYILNIKILKKKFVKWENEEEKITENFALPRGSNLLPPLPSLIN